jgi:hypothetical protein
MGLLCRRRRSSIFDPLPQEIGFHGELFPLQTSQTAPKFLHQSQKLDEQEPEQSLQGAPDASDRGALRSF